MLHLHDRATTEHALTLDLDPTLRRLLTERIAALDEDLIDQTEFLVVQPGDTEEDIVRHVGFSPLVEPIDGIRYGLPGFHPFWDWLVEHDGWFEMIVTFGSTFAYVLLVQNSRNSTSEVVSICREYCTLEQ
ncbi:hypothetical protein [Sphingomonas sp. CFBP 13720]|uniref:hypothetical protein n=1 Tax=Sphingomonas sp. CFBP 13720 TaxID=2775302 RepID=UPI00177CA4D2|nr:hypothetical protein [Sphingomonas sp. CFBP 13720]MBD8679653.1 hypothetical protein [Sphingomonas sp. CFBP 13720]